MLSKNFGLAPNALNSLPKQNLYNFPADLPTSLAQDKAAVGGRRAESRYLYTLEWRLWPPPKETSGGSVRGVDSHSFPAAKNIAAGLITVKPGGMRELQWHPNASEWQYYQR
jgi:oxalate decarboxylase